MFCVSNFKIMFLSKKLKLYLAPFVCILLIQLYRHVDFSSHIQVIKPNCKCSRESINYILIQKQQYDKDILLIISLIEENNKNEIQTRKNLFNMTLDEAKRFNKTCDLYNVLRRGPNQKIISYSLYGTKSRYTRNLEGIVDMMRLKYAGYTARVVTTTRRSTKH